MSKKYVQALTQYLAGSGVIIGATSVVLTSFNDIYGNALALSDFGDKGYGTLEPDTTNEEAFTFTSVTPNANGTVTLGGVSTALAKSPYTETSGLIRSHSGGTKAVITDNVAFWNTFANKNNAETVLGKYTFPGDNTNRPTASSDTDSVTNTDFVTLGQMSRQAISGAANASPSVKGIVQEATQAQVDARTVSGSTGAELYAPLDKIRASKYHDALASTGSANAYVLTIVPAQTAYAAGQVFAFIANFANTGTATLNVSGLGAKTIKKVDGATNLASGDIASGQSVILIYDGTNMQMLSPVGNPPLLPTGSGASLSGITPAQIGAASLFKNGTTSRTGDTASGSQTIAHGLGVTPKFIRITALKFISATANADSTGVFNGTTTSCVNRLINVQAQTDTSNIILISDNGSGSQQIATPAFDSTNITLTWTKAGTPNANAINIVWEAFA